MLTRTFALLSRAAVFTISSPAADGLIGRSVDSARPLEFLPLSVQK